jgi:hypothetical protein
MDNLKLSKRGQPGGKSTSMRTVAGVSGGRVESGRSTKVPRRTPKS